MKKTISLFLALVLCLSLCACGGGSADFSNPVNDDVGNPDTDTSTSTNGTTENTTDAKEELYTAVIEKLNLLVGDLKDPISLTEEDATYLIEKLTELGNYKDCQQLLLQFSVIENALVKITNSGIDNLGNQVVRTVAWYEYDNTGRIISGNSDFLHEEYGVYNPMGGCDYRYDETGKLIEVLVMSGSTVELRGTPAYDENGNLISMSIATNYGEKTATFEYDEQNRRIKSKFPYDGHWKEITYSYDDAGNLIHTTEKQIGPEEYVSSLDYSYVDDQLSQLVKVKTRNKEVYTYTYLYTNDSDGNPITVNITTDDPNYLKNLIWTYHYKTLYFYTPAN